MISNVAVVMSSLIGLAVVVCKRYRVVSSRSVPVAVGLSLMLHVAAGERVSILSGGSIEERKLLNEELDRETGY